MTSFEEYQEFCKTTDLFPKTKYDQEVDLLEYRTLCLCGEVGELANKVKKIRRDDNNQITIAMKRAVIHELGDVLWYVSTICTLIDVDMGLVAKENVKMLSKRKEEGKITGSGDDR